MLTFCSRIVVPYDGSKLSMKALDAAISFLKHDDRIELDVITVVNLRAAVHHHSLSLVDIDQIRETEFSAAKEGLRKAEDRLWLIPSKIRTMVLEGDPSKIICQYISENNIDLVIMGSRGLSGIEELFLGSVSHHVVQKSSCPVLVIK